MGRKDAERQLLGHGNQRGTFLIRESETTKGRTGHTHRNRHTHTHRHRHRATPHCMFSLLHSVTLHSCPSPPPVHTCAPQVLTLCPSATGTKTRGTTSSTIRSANSTTGATTSPPGLSSTPCSSWWSTTQVTRRRTTHVNSAHAIYLFLFFFNLMCL